MITDHAVLLNGSVASLPGVTLVARNAPSVRSLQTDALSKAVAMHIQLLENMNALSGEDLAAKPDAAGTPRAAMPTPGGQEGRSEEDSAAAYETAAREALVLPPEMPEVSPAASGNAVSITPAGGSAVSIRPADSDAVAVSPGSSVEYRISEPPRSDIVLIPEPNALDLTA